jgi:hypothetical protein
MANISTQSEGKIIVNKLHSSLGLFMEINKLDVSDVTQNQRDEIVEKYAEFLDLLCKIKQEDSLSMLKKEFEKYIREKKGGGLTEKENEGSLEDSDISKNITKAIEKLNLVGETDDAIRDFSLATIEPLQNIFAELLKNDSRQEFVLLNDDEIIVKTKQIFENYKSHTVCNFYKQNSKSSLEVPRVDIFSMFNFLQCQTCFHSEDEHVLCQKYVCISSSDILDRKCYNCGINEQKHKVCDDFISQKNFFAFASCCGSSQNNICEKCGRDYYYHSKKMIKTQYPCKKYTANEYNEKCQRCKFEMYDHTYGTSYWLLPVELREKILCYVNSFNLIMSLSNDEYDKSIRVLFEIAFYIPNYMDFLFEIRQMADKKK